ncbi:MAG: hypothetical protein J2P17_13580 [Mycobacterium sp.]|nr:hypothetical protein [Mycobacterium sp.]
MFVAGGGDERRMPWDRLPELVEELDFDATVVDIVSRAVWLLWTPERGKPRRHAPDFLVRSADGAACSSELRQYESSHPARR